VAFGDETTNYDYKYDKCTRNLLGRSYGRCLLNRLSSGSSMRFTMMSFGCVLRAVAADFFFDCWCLEIPSDSRILHVPKSVHYHALQHK
jgi:hypothetical protein